MRKYRVILNASLMIGLFTSCGLSQADPGTDTAKLMEYWYRLTARDCGSGRLASDCSGLILRGIASKQSYLPWDASPFSHSVEAGGSGLSAGGTSVSYLRKDVEFNGLGMLRYNGFALTPNDFVDDKTQFKIKVLCAFVIDSWTNYRNNNGCGDYQENGNTLGVVEDYCQKLSISNPKAWMEHYDRQTQDPEVTKAHRFQCGFDTTRDYFGSYNKADAFNTFVEARKVLAKDPEEQGDAINTQSELRIETWPDNKYWNRDWSSQDRKKFDAPVASDSDSAKATRLELPIAAFIYESGVDYIDRTTRAFTARDFARDDQRRWVEQGNAWKPIIKVQFPRSIGEDAKFAYYPVDQQIPAPADSRSCDNYIEKLEWDNNYVEPVLGTISSLKITPTACGRKAGVGKTNVVLAELAIKAAALDPNRKDWNFDNMGSSMRRQLACHLDSPDIAENKPTWSLEPARPYVPHDVIMKLPGDNRCNPH
ncbi:MULTISPECIES: DUF2599 domain-containing protein [Pseudomonas]|mgnify:CR=1 FL=1|uniref:DUF2599 domain-containing protein n=1 Tax=Pseudomonas fluorescens TaxID=294 RepID=A0A0D0P3L9_PSEFL|nr:DUF2599 domain-containing protein [Pseudomonas fluorescens]KIQ56839.1 hypothetical protein RL74_23970 [Pseudomonas fluorescens]